MDADDWRDDLDSLNGDNDGASGASASDWDFMSEWFDVLRGRLRVADFDRHDTNDGAIGREPTDRAFELTIEPVPRNASYPQSPTTSKHGTDGFAAVDRLREALVLLRLMAFATGSAGLRSLQQAVELEIPSWMDLATEPLHCQFIVKCAGRIPIELARLFDDPMSNPSHAFERHYKKARRLATAAAKVRKISDQVAPSLQVRIRVLVIGRGHTSHTSAQERDLLATANALMDILACEERLSVPSTSAASGHVVVRICLDSVELDLSALALHTRVLRAIRRVVETQAPIGYLRLPDDAVRDTDLCSSVFRQSWSQLACSICGLDAKTSGLQPLRRPMEGGCVVLSARYLASPQLAVPFFSAVKHAIGVNIVHLDFSMLSVSTLVKEYQIIWAWFACSLLSPTSTSYVRNLHVDGLELTRDAVQSLINIQNAQDPRMYVWQTTVPTDGEECVRVPRRITLNVGTEVIPCGFGEDEPAPFRLCSVWDAHVVRDDPMSDFVGVELVGFGFFLIHRQLFPNKRARQQPSDQPTAPFGSLATRSTCIQSLWLRCIMGIALDIRDARTALIEFLNVIGHNLTTLSLGATMLDAPSLEEILVDCPQLTAFQLVKGQSELMACFPRIYELGRRIESLDLSFPWLHIEGIHEFLALLTQDSPARHSLKRLRIKMLRSRMAAQTESIVKRVLEDTITLTHLQLSGYRPSDASTAPEPLGEMFHSAFLPLGPIALRAKLAFLSAMQDLRRDSDAPPLDQDALALILAFAAPVVRRIVIIDTQHWF